MFRIIGGVVVYGFALYGAATALGRYKAALAGQPPRPGADDPTGKDTNERTAAASVGASTAASIS